MCYEKNSGADKVRTGAVRIKKTGTVIQGRVSSPAKDRTDWHYIYLPRPGQLTVQLHWDNGAARLQLSVFDVMGIKIQDGRPWGSGGLKSTVVIERRGRYYVRVRAVDEDDASHYSLRLFFKGPGTECKDQGCTAGDKKCLGEDGFIVCEERTKSCFRWSTVFACPDGQKCKEGACGGSCDVCRRGSRRCAGSKAHQVCKRKNGCWVWGRAGACRGALVCKRGRCVAASAPVRAVKPPPRPSRCIKGKIISMYTYRGRPTLHIEVGANSGVRPGFIGWVLEGNTGKYLPAGQIQVTRVQGRFCIATTTLTQLGMNRRVCIKAR
jgi:hypothetical protein